TTETRVPGSSTIVPANPFTELAPEALESFIDCTLYEEPTPQPEPPDFLAAGSTESTPIVAPRAATEPPVPARRPCAAVLTALVGAAIGLGSGWLIRGLDGREEPTAVARPAPVPAPAAPSVAALPAPVETPAAQPANEPSPVTSPSKEPSPVTATPAAE